MQGKHQTLSIAGIVFTLLFLFPPPAHALIFLPALILIPIAQLLAFLLGSLSLPVVLSGFIWSRLFKKSWKRGLIYSLAFLVVLGIIIAVVLKITTPERPLF